MDKYCFAQRTAARPSLVLVSNAGGSLITDPGHTYDGNKALKQAGWKVQSDSGERLPQAADSADFRYAESNFAAASALVTALNQPGLPIRPVSPKKRDDIRGNLEVWISSR